MTVIDFIYKDFYRYTEKKLSLKSFISAVRIPGFWFMILFRLGSVGNISRVRRLVIRILLRRYSYKFGYQIPLKTKIGEGFFIGHYGSLVISPRAVIGKNCNVAHGVTIGAVMFGKRAGAPNLGDFVWVGTNAIIVGGINVGNNVLIAPGAFVNFDVPDNSIVIGNPGKIISKLNPTNDYIKNYF